MEKLTHRIKYEYSRKINSKLASSARSLNYRKTTFKEIATAKMTLVEKSNVKYIFHKKIFWRFFFFENQIIYLNLYNKSLLSYR